MSTYKINFSDPLRPSFQIQAAAYNGPGDLAANSSLRLYGKGALQWGESVDENMLRTLESFAGATPPYYPNPGQLWAKQELYWKNSNIQLVVGQEAPIGAFYRYRFENKTWQTRNTSYPFTVLVVNDMPITGGNIGQYVYHAPTATLYRWDAPYEQMPATWMPRAYSLATSAPGNVVPKQRIMVFGVDNTWSQIQADGGGGSGSGNGYGRIDTITAVRSLTLDDIGGIVRYNSTTDATFTLPAETLVNFPVGSVLTLRQVGDGKIRIEPANNVTLRVNVGFPIAVSAGRGSTIELIKVATNEWDATGDFQYV